MTKETFIEKLNRSSPNEIREFLIKKGKRKKYCPIILYKEEDIDDTTDVRSGRH